MGVHSSPVQSPCTSLHVGTEEQAQGWRPATQAVPKVFFTLEKKKKAKYFIATEKPLTSACAQLCVQTQAGSPMPGRDKVAMWSLPAWPTPQSLLHHLCNTPHDLMQCPFLSDELPRSLNSNFVFYWGWDGENLSPPLDWGLPDTNIQGNPSGQVYLSSSVCQPAPIRLAAFQGRGFYVFRLIGGSQLDLSVSSIGLSILQAEFL